MLIYSNNSIYSEISTQRDTWGRVRQDSEIYHGEAHKLVNKLFEFTKQQMKPKIQWPSLVSGLLNEEEREEEEEEKS